MFLVVLVNIFPSGYVFGGGDTIQFFGNWENLRSLFFDWGGRAWFFYLIFYLLNIFGISEAGQLSWYLGVFIFGSYISFFIFSRLILEDSPGKRAFASLFYALNLYTLFIFTGNWGYSYFPSLYIFLPLMLLFFIKFIKTQKNIFGALFVLILFLGSSGFGNPAFLLSFIIFLSAVFLGLLIFGYFQWDNKLAVKLFFLAVFSFLINSFWILPLVPEISQGVEKLQSSEVVEFDWWIRHSASPIVKTVSLNHFSEDYFPYNFYYKDFSYFKVPFMVISFLPMLVIAYGLAFFRKKMSSSDHSLFLSFLFVLVIFIPLVARLIEPFERINYYIYHLPGFVTLRGYDKTAIFIPFVLATLLLLTINHLSRKKAFFILILILIIPLPFYLGKLQQTAGYRVNSEKDFRKAAMSFLVKIPDEYHSVRPLIANDKDKFFLAALPATKSDGSGIVYYPKWNFYGADMSETLYNRKQIQPNVVYFNEWNFAEEFGEQQGEKNDWLPKLLGMMNVKYLIYHKDAPESSVEKSQNKIDDLKNKGLIKNIENNEYFTLYEINSSLFFPYITYQQENLDFQNDSVWIERNLEKMKNLTASADFREINPKKFEVLFDNLENQKELVLAESYNSNWKAYAILKNGREIEIENHFMARGYANGWKIDSNPDIKKIVIEYYPTRLLCQGSAVSLLALLFLSVYLVRYYYNKRGKNNV